MRSHRALALVAPAAVLLLLLGARQAEAQASSDWVAVKGMDERFRLDLGGFFQKFDDDGPDRLRAVRTGDRGQPRGRPRPRLEPGQLPGGRLLALRPARTARLRLHGVEPDADHVIDRDITIGDTIYHAGATLDSRLKVSLAELYYGYSFWNTPEFEVGLQLGLTALFNKVEFDGTGTISGGGGSTGGSFSSEEPEPDRPGTGDRSPAPLHAPPRLPRHRPDQGRRSHHRQRQGQLAAVEGGPRLLPLEERRIRGGLRLHGHQRSRSRPTRRSSWTTSTAARWSISPWSSRPRSPRSDERTDPA